MDNRMAGYFTAVSLVLATASSATAWHERGHMAVALIAYRQLDAGKQKQVLAILKKHPHYKEFLSAQRPSDAPLDEWVFMRAAVWPDWVRQHHKDEGFNKPVHHYVNLPIKWLDGASEKQKNQIEKNITDL